MRHDRIASKLLRGAALWTLAPAASLLAPAAALAQEEGPDSAASEDNTGEDILVTGTRIRGVAPVGSDLLQLSAEDLAKTGQLSTADILAKVPAVLTLGSGNSYSGGSSQSTSDLNAMGFNKSPNLRGFGPQATLSLVNGHRVPYDGANMNTFDGDNIPVQMLQRVEIVADGTSATYGADAISGTVNYIMRAPFTGLEVYGQYGTADGQDSWQATAVGGYDWGSGGIVVAYQHADSDRLRALSRPNLYNDDFSPYGGPPSPAFSSPGNILYGGNSYAIPTGQDGSALTLAEVGAAGTVNRQNIWTGYDAIPAFERDQVAVNFTQEIGSGIEIYADGFYSQRDFDIALFSSAPNSRATLVVPNSNFYSPCNRSLVGADPALVAACGTGSLTVQYNLAEDVGGGTREGFVRTYMGTVGVNVDLFGDWRANVYTSHGRSRGENSTNLYFGNGFGGFFPQSPALTAALADNTSAAFNPFCDSGAQDCGNGGFEADIFAGQALNVLTVFKNQVYSASVDGSLLTLPGGNVRLAVGGEHQKLSFTNGNNFATTFASRKIYSAFGELYVPVFGADNRTGGLYSLDLTAAIRLDDYNDVGSTWNPKFGLNWAPTEWLKLRASYGTSFRAPTLVDNDPNSQAGHLPFTIDGGSIDPALCPTCDGTNRTIYYALGGAAGNLTPENSESWSVGFEIAPPTNGLRLSATYWNVNYTGQVSTPVYNVGAFQAINAGYYDSEIIFNPTYFPGKAASNPVAFFGPYPFNASIPTCANVAGQAITTQALYDDLVACINAGGTSPVLGAPSNDVIAINNGHRLNAGSTHGDGFDISASYDWSSAGGDFHIGAIASYINNWKVSPIPGAPVTDEVNRFGYPLRLRGRADASWTGNVGPGDLTLAGYVNYANGYEMNPIFLPAGVADSYADIDSYTTVDLAVNYSFGDDAGSILRGLSLTVSAQNVFDADPPLVINSGPAASLRFDPSNASPIGRIFQFQVAKKF